MNNQYPTSPVDPASNPIIPISSIVPISPVSPIGPVNPNCPICTEVITIPYISECKHNFCIECVLSWSNCLHKRGFPTNCPMCRAEMNRNNILETYDRQFGKEGTNIFLSLEDFISLRGVRTYVQQYMLESYDKDLLLDSKDNNWLNGLKSVLSWEFKRLRDNDYLFPKIGEKD